MTRVEYTIGIVILTYMSARAASEYPNRNAGCGQPERLAPGYFGKAPTECDQACSEEGMFIPLEKVQTSTTVL